jgi:UDP-N-acetylmuramoylalanine--D-glutamate ligase
MPEKKFPSYKNKKVLIFGLGVLGRGIKDAIFFANRGAKVIVTDLKTEEQLETSLAKLEGLDITYHLGEHREADFDWADLIIRNAAVPMSSPYLQYAVKKGKRIEMDESLFAKYCPCHIIGITGTRGKSTTTTLIGKISEYNKELLGKRKIFVSGNLQGEATLPLIDEVTADDLVVLELSSWQLQGFGADRISPHIAVVTNVYPDHLNYYKGMGDYATDKEKIFLNQKKRDYCVLNENNDYTRKMQERVPGILRWFSKRNVPKRWKLRMLGEHNIENAAAAMAVGKILGLTRKEMEIPISEFSGLEHRMEFVKEINNITFINDTTSTTPIAGQKALASIDAPIVLIAGGATKNLALTEFAKELVQKVKAVVLLDGSATDDLKRDIKQFQGEHLILGRYHDFHEAVERAYAQALPGDTVLLSPGCASFGMFKNEFDRGEQFKRIVNQIK